MLDKKSFFFNYLNLIYVNLCLLVNFYYFFLESFFILFLMILLKKFFKKE